MTGYRHAVRWIGIALLCTSLALGLFAYGLDTTVTTGAVWRDGVFQGVTEVHDANMAEQRDNRLAAARALALIGGILVGVTILPKGTKPPLDHQVPGPR